MRWKSRVLGLISTLGLGAVLILGAHAGQGGAPPSEHELASKLTARAEASRRDGQPVASSQLQAQLSRAPVHATPAPYPQLERSKVMVAQVNRIGYVAPAYPRKALDEGLSGSVTVDFIINAKGEPTELRIADAKPAGVFDQAALDAVKRWRYEPFTVNGVPTPIPTRAALHFDPQNP